MRFKTTSHQPLEPSTIIHASVCVLEAICASYVSDARGVCAVA